MRSEELRAWGQGWGWGVAKRLQVHVTVAGQGR